MRISLATALVLAGLLSPPAGAQQPAGSDLSLSTEAVLPSRFAAAHGARALLMGYSGDGLEAWAYPFQLFRNYRVEFLPQGSASVVNGNSILRRIEYRPEEIVRIYAGPDFVVREHLLVPPGRPAVVVRYETAGRTPVDIRISFLPVLNLMWPAAIGGQDLNWDPALSAYTISERTSGYRALMASPQQFGHTPLVNSTRRQDLSQSMVLHPAAGEADFYAVLEPSSTPQGSALRDLEAQPLSSFTTAAEEHTATVLHRGLQIVTPDADLNRAIAWSRVALDQAWVCNDRLGCGLVAGYGPSRGMRRPQYAWFFAGDGLVATEALLAEGDTDRARQELEFILRYQNPENGMIWHELSQSAGFLDWAGKYPYMYVHVDITFDFLSTLGDYYRQTADLAFLREHWTAISAAYGYCRSLVNPQTSLPQIPAEKEGGNEQERMREDVGLSAAWVAAADAYRQLAAATGHQDDSAEAAQSASAARQAVKTRYWDPHRGFWIAGYSQSGAPMTDEHNHPGLLGQGLLTPGEESAALARIASSDFETDWGTRGISSRSAHFNPDSYASGSVSALATAATAEAFWRDHLPSLAAPIWKSLLPWLQLGSLGHLHEVAAGDFFRPQVESVPEQTWSSAGLLSSVVHGLFGLEVDAPERHLRLAPHLDPRWNHVSIRRIDIGPAQLDAAIEQTPQAIAADFSSRGSDVSLTFAPQIPLGATGLRATVDGRKAVVVLERQGEDEHARVALTVPAHTIHCRIIYSGGVSLVAPAPHPEIGGASRQLKLTNVQLDHGLLTLDADIENSAQASLQMRTPWKISALEGGVATPLEDGWYTITFADPPVPPDAPYVRRRMTIRLDNR